MTGVIINKEIKQFLMIILKLAKMACQNGSIVTIKSFKMSHKDVIIYAQN